MPFSSFTSGIWYLTVAPFAAVASTTMFCIGVNVGGVMSEPVTNTPVESFTPTSKISKFVLTDVIVSSIDLVRNLEFD